MITVFLIAREYIRRDRRLLRLYSDDGPDKADEAHALLVRLLPGSLDPELLLV